ncbi:MAG: choice-of-anchor Q domain-containing protein [Methylococcaceae bacterium]
MSTNVRVLPFRSRILVAALALATGSASAATINVGGDCILANAIKNANKDLDMDGSSGCPAGRGNDVVELEANATYTLTAIDNFNSSGPNGLPLISSVITINGNGAAIERSNAGGTPDFRLFNVLETGNLSINKLRLSGGKSPLSGRGGAILNAGVLAISDSTISNNSSVVVGGGIENEGLTLTVTNSVISNNQSANAGGIGSIMPTGGTTTIINSSISGNSAGLEGGGIVSMFGVTYLVNTNLSGNTALIGGGINFKDASISITNSTISGNSATADGGAAGSLYFGVINLINSTVSGNMAGDSGGAFAFGEYDGTVNLTNSTVSGNSAAIGGVLSSYVGSMNITHSTISANTSSTENAFYFEKNGSITLTNSIIADNGGGYLCRNFLMQGVNLIEDVNCRAPIKSDPKLRALLDNGGPTPTRALTGDSSANNAADLAFCNDADQLNVERLSTCDLGAFEKKAKVPETVAPLVQFFDAQVENNEISGRVKGETVDRRIAFRNQLLTAGDYRNRRLDAEACGQLSRSLERIVTDGTAENDDYVTGSGEAALINEINLLRNNWGCS